MTDEIERVDDEADHLIDGILDDFEEVGLPTVSPTLSGI